jgi:hypothetical protein
MVSNPLSPKGHCRQPAIQSPSLLRRYIAACSATAAPTRELHSQECGNVQRCRAPVRVSSGQRYKHEKLVGGCRRGDMRPHQHPPPPPTTTQAHHPTHALSNPEQQHVAQEADAQLAPKQTSRHYDEHSHLPHFTPPHALFSVVNPQGVLRGWVQRGCGAGELGAGDLVRQHGDSEMPS